MTREEQILEQKKKLDAELASIKKKKLAEKRAEEKLCRKYFGASAEEVQLQLDNYKRAGQLIARYLRAKGAQEISLDKFEGYVRGAEQKNEAGQ